MWACESVRQSRPVWLVHAEKNSTVYHVMIVYKYESIIK